VDHGALLLRALHDELRIGLDRARRGADLADTLGVNERTIRALVGELIDHGVLVASVCSGSSPGYFLPASEEEADLGTKHLRSRALAMLRRYRLARLAAETSFGEDVALRLFPLDDELVGAGASTKGDTG
jgi:hypothetical protein